MKWGKLGEERRMRWEDKRRKALEKIAEDVEKRAMREYGELVLTLNRGIESSTHLLKGGGKEPFFVDFDCITEDALACKKIGEGFSERIQQIADHWGRKPDFLGFIEKDGIGTVGALKLSGYISSGTDIPNILIRHTRELPYARIKISEDKSANEKRLEGKKVLVISDVSTTGTELMDAIKDIQDNGGEVTDVILYFSRCSIETLEYFQRKGVTLHPLINESMAREIAQHPDYKERANKIRDVFSKVDRSISERSEA